MFASRSDFASGLLFFGFVLFFGLAFTGVLGVIGLKIALIVVCLIAFFSLISIVS